MRFAWEHYPLGRFWTVRALGLGWDSYDWSLSVYRASITGPDKYYALFSLRCQSCRSWTLGCYEHWFCGVCRSCDAAIEAIMSEGDDAA